MSEKKDYQKQVNQAYPYYYYPLTSQAYYPYDFRQVPNQYPQPAQETPPGIPAQLPMEESYIENILRLNEGKMATVYMSFENNSEWSSKVFKGIIEAAGRDHIVLSDPQTGKRYLLLMIYLDYVTFEGEINYAYPYGNSQMANYPPR